MVVHGNGVETVDQSGNDAVYDGIVTRNTNSWSGNECFNNSLPRGPPAAPCSLKILFSSSDRCNFALSWQRRVHRSSDVSPASPPSPLSPLLLSLQSAVNCFQLNCLPFSRHPFAARHRLFAPFNVARFRDSPNFPPAGKESESAGEEGKGSSRLRPRRRGVNARKFPTEGRGFARGELHGKFL